jgi:predicted nucleic acid-binding protein
MTAFVLDCSIAVSWCFEDEAAPATDALLERVRDHGAIVPSLWHWEIANVLTVAVRRNRITASDESARLSLLATLPIATDSEGVARAWRETLLLAQTHALTVYDASYLELAVRLGADLATKDASLARVAKAVGVTVVP